MATDATEINDKPATKKIKLDQEDLNSNLHDEIKDLSTFKLDKILNNNTQRKTVCLQGYFGNAKEIGLVILEKGAFEEKDIKKEEEGYFTANTKLKKLFHNDVYGNYESFPLTELNC